MQVEPKPLGIEIPAEVPLRHAPLVRVIAQIRFPPILSIRKEGSVADFQEALRAVYPYLAREETRSIDIGSGQDPNAPEMVIWRLADQPEAANWRVSLGVDFIALETSRYASRTDFLDRLQTILAKVEACFNPASAQRIGLRYIDQLKGAALVRIGDLVESSILGILQAAEGSPGLLRDATVHQMTQAQLLAEEGVIQGRWGSLSPNVTYDPDVLQPIPGPSWVLDLDMFAPNVLPFQSEQLTATADVFAKRIYSVFRQMITDEFLVFYGGNP